MTKDQEEKKEFEKNKIKYKCIDCSLRATEDCPVDYWSPTAPYYSEICEKFKKDRLK